MEILLIDVDVAGIEVGVVLSVYSSFHHVSPTSWPSMMIGALETIRKYETANAHLVNDKYAKRRFVEQRYSQHPGPFYIFRKPNPTLFQNRFHCMRGSRIDFFLGGGG